jgi:hypothetical protein
MLEGTMRKLKLHLDALAVESFDTASLLGRPGTVRGNDTTATNEVSCYYTVCETDCSCLAASNCCTPDSECCLTDVPCPDPTHYATCLGCPPPTAWTDCTNCGC